MPSPLYRLVEGRKVVARDWGEGEMGSCYLMETEFQSYKMKNFGNLLHTTEP